ncbi:hypothetical protein ACTFIU_001700 [Dictyostelium citrinum]
MNSEKIKNTFSTHNKNKKDNYDYDDESYSEDDDDEIENSQGDYGESVYDIEEEDEDDESEETDDSDDELYQISSERERYSSNNNNTIQQQAPPKSYGYQRMFKRLLLSRSNQQKTVVQERVIASYKVYGWLINYDPAYESTAFRREVLAAIDEIFDIVLAILDMMKCSSNLLIPIIIYADKFVNRSGIKHNQLFNLLLTSTVVSLKFWSESTQVNNAIIAEIFNFSLKDMNLMERRFLTGVDYNLFLNSTHTTNFLFQLYENQHTFLSYFKHPFDNPPQIFTMPNDLIQHQQNAQLQMIQKQKAEQIEQQKLQLLKFQQQQQQINNTINNNNYYNNNIHINNNNNNNHHNNYHPYPVKKQLTNQRYQQQQALNQKQSQQQQQQQELSNPGSYQIQMVSPMC